MAAFGLPESNESFEQLVNAYSQKHRHYHTCAHIDHCLRELDTASGLAEEPAALDDLQHRAVPYEIRSSGAA